MADTEWAEPDTDQDLYLVLASAPHDGAQFVPVAWCHNRSDSLDIADTWAQSFPARVLVRAKSDGGVSLVADIQPRPRPR